MFNLGPMWGIDIGDHAVKAVKLKRVGKQVVLLDFHTISYSDLSGEAGTQREGMIPEALDALKAAGMGKDRCWVSIAPQTVFSRFISLPPVDRRRIPEIVLYEARQQIPFSLEEVIWSYQTVRKEFEVGEEIEIGLFAVKREVVDAYLLELAPIKRQLHGIQVGPLALHNFVFHEMDLHEPTVILDIGSQSTDLLIVDGEKFWLRNLPIAGRSFTSVLEKRLNIPYAEAEKLKCGLAESRHRRKLLEVLRPPMRDLVAEVQRSVGYYKSLAQDVKFENILVMGDGYQLFGLDRFLADQLQYKIRPVHQLETVPFQGERERMEELKERIPSLGPAIGLALQGLGEARGTINLLPDDFVVDRELHAKRFNGLIAAGLVWAIVGCFWLMENRAVSEMRGMERAGAGTLTRVKKKTAEFNKAKGERDRQRAEQFAKLGRNREYYARVIGAVAAVIPKDVRVDGGFQFVGGGAAAGSEADLRMDRGGPGRPTGRAARDAGSGSGPKGLPPGCLELRFAVTVPEVEQDFFQGEFPERLKQATIFPEKMPLIVPNGVLIGSLVRTEVKGLAEAGEVTRPALSTTVRLGLVAPDQLEATRREHMEKLAAARRKAAAAKKARLAAETAKAGAPGASDEKEGAGGSAAAAAGAPG